MNTRKKIQLFTGGLFAISLIGLILSLTIEEMKELGLYIPFLVASLAFAYAFTVIPKDREK